MSASYSILVTIRRVTTEVAHVKVPVTDTVTGLDDRLDGGKVFVEACRLGAAPDVVWALDGKPVIDVNPMQTPPPRAEN